MKSFISKSLLLLAIICSHAIDIHSQNNDYTLNENKTEVTLNIDFSKKQSFIDNESRKARGQAIIEARLYPLMINMDSIGLWTKSFSDKENIWKFRINVPQSKGFFISLDDFYIPVGGKLFVYNKDNFQQHLVFSHEDNPNGGPYSIENLRGDNVVLEYIADKNVKEQPRFIFTELGYKYSDETDNLSGFESSRSCMININCPQGDNWQIQKKGVVRLRLRKINSGVNDGALCSGTLINNTSNDRTPYVLTAYHCLENVDITDPNNFSFFFEYEMPTCENTGIRPPYKFHRGAVVKVLNSTSIGSDGILLQLTDTIPDNWDVYFNGWDRNNIASDITNGAVLHHPNGDVKKISLFAKTPISGRWQSSSPYDSYWIVNYSDGATQGGSSGAPLFNQNGLVIGTLTGGTNSCSNISSPDYYGKFWYHWDKSENESFHMKSFLDPENTGQTMLAGLLNNPNLEKDLVLDKSSIGLLLNSTATTTILSGNGGYSLTSSDPSIAKAEITENSISIRGLKKGTTILTITDKKNKQATLTVYVRDEIDISKQNQNIVASILNPPGTSSDDKIQQVRIINLDGDVLYDKKNIDQDSHIIDMTLFRNSLYIIQVKTKAGTVKAEKILWRK